MKMLVIDDDKRILESLAMTFKLCWPEAEFISTRSGEEGIQLVDEVSPDIIIVDLGLPDINGFDVVKQIRQYSNVPIIILTIRDEEADVVTGLGLGANDYIVKPFRQMELIARIKANTHKQNILTEQISLTKGKFQLNAYKHELFYNEKHITLTRSECVIFAELMNNANSVVTHYRLAQALWGREYPGAEEAIRVYMKRLRDKIEEDPANPRYIFTMVSQGYLLSLSS
jgi:two-component system KDP operon response regulator KdpE